MTTKKPSAKKAVTGKRDSSKKKITAKKKSAGKKNTAPKKPSRDVAKFLSGEELFQYAQETAYYLAERDGFQGDPNHYWLEAQRALELGD